MLLHFSLFRDLDAHFLEWALFLILVSIFLSQKGDLGHDSIPSALVAQLDRVPGYEPGGQRFESSPVQFFRKGNYDP